MRGNNSRPTRVEPLFTEWAKDIALERIKKGLEKEMISPREVTRMFMNTESRGKVEEELTSRPRRMK